MAKTYNVLQYKQTIIDNNPNLIFKYLDSELKNTKSNITYVCKQHGQLQRAAIYLHQGRGCSKCAYDLARKKRTSTIEQFIEKSNNIHKNKYTYLKSVYVNSSSKIIITCLIHGDFEQVPSMHLKGHGCYKCGLISTARNSYFNQSIENKSLTLYYIKCYGKGEMFYKIGVTKVETFERYLSHDSMPYMYEILREIKGNTERILDLEKEIKSSIKQYIPLIKFSGSATECSLEEINLDDYLVK